MRTNIFLSAIIVAVFIAACNSSENKTAATSADSTAVSTLPKTILKVTKQYVTNPDGSVQENPVNTTIGYNEQEVCVTFADSADKSFTIKVVSFDKKVEGTLMRVKDRKYSEVFVSSGAKPQVTFTSERGFGNMTFM